MQDEHSQLTYKFIYKHAFSECEDENDIQSIPYSSQFVS